MLGPGKSLDRKEALVGFSTMALALASFFWWGIHFQVFGSQISWSERPVETGGFFGWLVLGAYGAGYTTGGSKRALRYSACAVGVFALAAGFGELGRMIS
jgi:hypothetical protein